MKSKFDVIFENNFSRFQGGGYLTGDIIKLKKGWEKDDWCKEAPAQTIDMLKSFDEQDLILRVSTVKTVRPAVNSSVDAAAGVDGFYIDVTQETAPGRYTGAFITVPHQIIELDGPNDKLPEIPDSMKRDEKISVKPKSLEEDQAENNPNGITSDTENDPGMTNPLKQTGMDDKFNRSLHDKDIKQPKAIAATSYTAGYLG